VTQINLQPIENLRKSNYGHSAIWMSQLQKGDKAADSESDGLTATQCWNHSVRGVQFHDSCTG
jgi:hypothetical protein